MAVDPDALECPIERIALADGLTLEQAWYATKPIDPGTLAIGEPAYHQCNWSYLISDGAESLLWDTGSGRRDIRAVLDAHAQPRLRAFPSHMHFDHLGGIHAVEHILLADLPLLRGLETKGQFTPTEALYLGAYEGLSAPTFAVSEWVLPGQRLRIGTRELEVLHTPGHAVDSVSLWEPEQKLFFAADLLYRGELYAQVPGASLPDYTRVLKGLLQGLPSDVRILGAHGQEENGRFDVPVLSFGDVEDTLVALQKVLSRPPADGAEEVNGHMRLLYSAESFEGAAPQT